MDTNNVENKSPNCCENKKSHIKLSLFGIIIGISLVASAVIVSYTILGIKSSENSISVSGSAKQKVVADNARWTARFSRNSTKEDIKNGYDLMKADEKVIRDFMISKGVTTYEVSPVFMNEIYKNDQNAPKEYNLSQDLEVKLDDPIKMKQLARDSESIAKEGVLFQSNPVEYYYSKLPELRISLLPEAIKDAKARASMIAESSGLSVKSVRSVSMGVVQVLSEGSIDVSDYGSYDTSKIDKEVMITVKASFQLK